MSKHLGDFDTSTIVYGKFTTYRPSTGAPFTLAGTPVLSVYKDNSTTQSTTGVTLTVDFDSVTGFNHYAIDTSADGTFYAAGSFFDVVITTGTVDSISSVGSVVGSFTIRKNSTLKPTTAGRTLDVSAGGEAGVDWSNVGSPTSTLNLSGTTISTAQVVASVTNRVTANTDQLAGQTVIAAASVTFPSSVGTSTFAGGAVASVTAGVTVTTNNDKTGYTVSTVSDKTGYSLSVTPPTSAQIATAVWQDNTAGDFTVASSIGKSLYTTGNSPGAASGLALVGSSMVAGTVSDKTGYSLSASQTFNLTGNITGNLSGSVGSLTTNNDKTGYSLTVTPPTAATIATAVWQDTTAGDFTVASSIGKSLYTTGNAPGAASGLALVGSNMGSVTSVSGAVGSVTGAVGSVTGNVGGNVTGSVGSVVAGVTASTVSDKTGYSLSAGGVTAVQTGLATPTNITAGTLTTVTNLTNLPTIPANWITAAGIATDAIGAAQLAASAVTEIQSGLATSATQTSQGTIITWLQNFLGGDKSIDTAVTPWAEVVKIAGTSTELIRKKLRDTAGANITASTSVIGSAKDA
jgi:hypothetical protein